MTLREVLHAHIPTLGPTSTFRDAVDKMDIYQFPALVVVDDHQQVLAVLTEGDLSRAAQRSDGLIRLSGHVAMNYGTANPTIASPETEISDALHLMLGSGLTVLPIVENSRFIGMVLRVDLMQAMLMDAGHDQVS